VSSWPFALVIPAHAGIQSSTGRNARTLDPGLRRDDVMEFVPLATIRQNRGLTRMEPSA